VAAGGGDGAPLPIGVDKHSAAAARRAGDAGEEGAALVLPQPQRGRFAGDAVVADVDIVVPAAQLGPGPYAQRDIVTAIGIEGQRLVAVGGIAAADGIEDQRPVAVGGVAVPADVGVKGREPAGGVAEANGGGEERPVATG